MGKSLYEHRVIYEMHYGFCPPLLDHINQDREDNRIENLRPITYGANNVNSSQCWSSCGFKGVSFYKARNKFMAKIGFGGKSAFLGYFDSPQEAHQKYLEAREKFYPGLVNA